MTQVELTPFLTSWLFCWHRGNYRNRLIFMKSCIKTDLFKGQSQEKNLKLQWRAAFWRGLWVETEIVSHWPDSLSTQDQESTHIVSGSLLFSVRVLLETEAAWGSGRTGRLLDDPDVNFLLGNQCWGFKCQSLKESFTLCTSSCPVWSKESKICRVQSHRSVQQIFWPVYFTSSTFQLPTVQQKHLGIIGCMSKMPVEFIFSGNLCMFLTETKHRMQLQSQPLLLHSTSEPSQSKQFKKSFSRGFISRCSPELI